MSKFIKKILNFQKEKNGNISILVLIISMAVILLTTAMVGYIFHDIGFTELDKGQLRALHFAESGLSNMYYKIEQYSESGVPLPPESPEYYTVYIEDPDPEGSFTVEYETYYLGEYSLIEGYVITSKGIDISSGVARTVRVNTLSFNIFDFIFSSEAMGASHIAGNTNITGPLFVDGDFGLITGNSSFLGGPLFVRGDIEISGSSSIGESDEPIILFLGGNMNGSEFDPLNPPRNVYVSDYYDTVLDIQLPTIDSDYINSLVADGALVINGDLFIGDEEIEVDGVTIDDGYDGYLKFDDGVLEINNNIVVYGNIDIGKSKGKKYTVEYSGKANLVSTGSITVGSQVIPDNMIDFPSDSLLVLISQNNINFDVTSANGGSYSDPSAAVMIIANGTVETSTNAFIRGSSVSDVLIMGQNTEIHYEPGIADELSAVSGLDSGIFTLEWQEIIE